MYSGMVMFWIFVCGVPLYDLISHIINNEEIDYFNARMPLPSFIPYNINGSFTLFTLVFAMQTLILAFFLFVIGLWALIGSCSLVYISCELELLCSIIHNIDNTQHKPEIDEDATHYLYNNYNIFTEDIKVSTEEKMYNIDQLNEANLKQTLSVIHRYHLEIVQ